MRLGYLHHGHGKTHAHVPVERNFHVVDAEGLDLHAAEEVHVRRASVDLAQLELDRSLGHRGIIRIEKTGVLLELSDASAPARPEAQLEKADGHLRRGDRSDDSDQCLRTADFRAHIFAQHRRLQIG